MRDTFVEKGEEFIKIIDNHIKKGSKEPVNMQQMFFSFTMDRLVELIAAMLLFDTSWYQHNENIFCS